MRANRRDFQNFFDGKLQFRNIKVERAHKLGNKEKSLKKATVAKFEGQRKDSLRKLKTKKYQH